MKQNNLQAILGPGSVSLQHCYWIFLFTLRATWVSALLHSLIHSSVHLSIYPLNFDNREPGIVLDTRDIDIIWQRPFPLENLGLFLSSFSRLSIPQLLQPFLRHHFRDSPLFQRPGALWWRCSSVSVAPRGAAAPRWTPPTLPVPHAGRIPPSFLSLTLVGSPIARFLWLTINYPFSVFLSPTMLLTLW